MNEDKTLTLQEDFQNNITILGEQTRALVRTISPYLTIDPSQVREYLDKDSMQILNGMHFFKLISYTTEQMDDMFTVLNDKMSKLFAAIHSLNVIIAYGVMSHDGRTSLVFGVDSKEAEDIIESLINGLMTGVELIPFNPNFSFRETVIRKGGIVSAIPAVRMEEEKQKFDISTLMRCLNGQEYTVLCIAKPYLLEDVQQKYGEIINIRDKCFAISKRNISRQRNESDTNTSTNSKSSSFNLGLVLGINLGGSWSKNESEAFTKTSGASESISCDVQNGFALEMMEYCDKAIERLRYGQSTGMWGTAIAYSAGNSIVANVIQACLCGELAKPTKDIFPMQKFAYDLEDNEQILIPSMKKGNPLLAPITSSELGLLCTPPYETVPDFELKLGKHYPMIASSYDDVVIGSVSDGHRPLDNMKYSLSETDLNKHTFVCGITGSGKTTTVKGILKKSNKPFMVIESAKKEYRNISIGEKPLTIYTLGKPELNCLQFNPFYIQYGINLQTHIDFLKDLFNASFSFYGPMPYILEKCLHNIYRNKGWNLTLGYHPKLVNMKNSVNIFDACYMRKQYDLKAHKYLFPTMQDLKNEVKYYIENELQYDGEVSGNIKTAMLARLDSLCVGSKGFMLNTSEPIAMDQLLQNNVVFELEGLADDSDKAFCVGLLVVFINEFRQVFKDEHPIENIGLQHILVIEEAHRLLKNIDTDKSSENLGNPKGKAVEHFTNMIAEMRSYGQGVIIAEQIPSKLAPDVIKNSSNKIIQRVVSSDDQILIANTIGIKNEDAMYLGNLKTGYALCHKEGMSLPVLVKVDSVEDHIVLDDNIFLKQESKMFESINRSVIHENTIELLSNISLKLLNSLLAQSPELVVDSIKLCKKALKKELIKKDIRLIGNSSESELLGSILIDGIMQLLVNGVYSLDALLDNAAYEILYELFVKLKSEYIEDVRDVFKYGYMQDPKSRCMMVISELIKQKYDRTVDIKKSIEQYFMIEEENLSQEIEDMVERRCLNASIFI